MRNTILSSYYMQFQRLEQQKQQAEESNQNAQSTSNPSTSLSQQAAKQTTNQATEQATSTHLLTKNSVEPVDQQSKAVGQVVQPLSMMLAPKSNEVGADRFLELPMPEPKLPALLISPSLPSLADQPAQQLSQDEFALVPFDVHRASQARNPLYIEPPANVRANATPLFAATLVLVGFTLWALRVFRSPNRHISLPQNNQPQNNQLQNSQVQNSTAADRALPTLPNQGPADAQAAQASGRAPVGAETSRAESIILKLPMTPEVYFHPAIKKLRKQLHLLNFQALNTIPFDRSVQTKSQAGKVAIADAKWEIAELQREQSGRAPKHFSVELIIKNINQYKPFEPNYEELAEVLRDCQPSGQSGVDAANARLSDSDRLLNQAGSDQNRVPAQRERPTAPMDYFHPAIKSLRKQLHLMNFHALNNIPVNRSEQTAFQTRKVARAGENWEKAESIREQNGRAYGECSPDRVAEMINKLHSYTHAQLKRPTASMDYFHPAIKSLRKQLHLLNFQNLKHIPVNPSEQSAIQVAKIAKAGENWEKAERVREQSSRGYGVCSTDAIEAMITKFNSYSPDYDQFSGFIKRFNSSLKMEPKGVDKASVSAPQVDSEDNSESRAPIQRELTAEPEGDSDSRLANNALRREQHLSNVKTLHRIPASQSEQTEQNKKRMEKAEKKWEAAELVREHRRQLPKKFSRESTKALINEHKRLHAESRALSNVIRAGESPEPTPTQAQAQAQATPPPATDRTLDTATPAAPGADPASVIRSSVETSSDDSHASSHHSNNQVEGMDELSSSDDESSARTVAEAVVDTATITLLPEEPESTLEQTRALPNEPDSESESSQDVGHDDDNDSLGSFEIAIDQIRGIASDPAHMLNLTEEVQALQSKVEALRVSVQQAQRADGHVDILPLSELLLDAQTHLDSLDYLQAGLRNEVKTDLQSAADGLTDLALKGVTDSVDRVVQSQVDHYKAKRQGRFPTLFSRRWIPGFRQSQRANANKGLKQLVNLVKLRQIRDRQITTHLQGAAPHEKNMLIKGTGELDRNKLQVMDGQTVAMPNRVSILFPHADRPNDSFVHVELDSRQPSGWGASVKQMAQVDGSNPAESASMQAIRQSSQQYQNAYRDTFFALKPGMRFNEELINKHRLNSLPQVLLEALMTHKQHRVMSRNDARLQGLDEQSNPLEHTKSPVIKGIKTYFKEQAYPVRENRDFTLLNRLDQDNVARPIFDDSMQALELLSQFSR